jgi:hypothetical protein
VGSVGKSPLPVKRPRCDPAILILPVRRRVPSRCAFSCENENPQRFECDPMAAAPAAVSPLSFFGPLRVQARSFAVDANSYRFISD